MGSAANFYTIVSQLHDEMEGKVFNQTQLLFREILKLEKQALLDQIKILVDRESNNPLSAFQWQLKENILQFQCHSCNKTFSANAHGTNPVKISHENSTLDDISDDEDPFLNEEEPPVCEDSKPRAGLSVPIFDSAQRTVAEPEENPRPLEGLTALPTNLNQESSMQGSFIHCAETPAEAPETLVDAPKEGQLPKVIKTPKTLTPKGENNAAKPKDEKEVNSSIGKMVLEAVTKLAAKKGSSLKAIRQYIALNNTVDIGKAKIRRAASRAVARKFLVKIKRTGDVASFKLSVKSKHKKKPDGEKTPKVKKVKPTDSPKIKKATPKKRAAGSSKVKKVAPKKPACESATAKKVAPKKTALESPTVKKATPKKLKRRRKRHSAAKKAASKPKSPKSLKVKEPKIKADVTKAKVSPKKVVAFNNITCLVSSIQALNLTTKDTE